MQGRGRGVTLRCYYLRHDPARDERGSDLVDERDERIPVDGSVEPASGGSGATCNRSVGGNCRLRQLPVRAELRCLAGAALVNIRRGLLSRSHFARNSCCLCD